MDASKLKTGLVAWLATGVVAVLALGSSGCDVAGSEIHITTTPGAAAVYCNNQKVGTSPLTVILPPKPRSDFTEVYIIEARLSGYEPGRKYLTESGPGELDGQSVRLSLRPLPAGLSDSDVPGRSRFVPRGAASNYLSRVACEVKLVRLGDGRVLAQASGMVCDDFLPRLSATLARQLKRHLPPGPDGTVAVCSIRNRRQTARGEKLARRFTLALGREMSFNSPRGLARDIDLRPLASESALDAPALLKRKDIRGVLAGAQYVVIGGLAEAVVP